MRHSSDFTRPEMHELRAAWATYVPNDNTPPPPDLMSRYRQADEDRLLAAFSAAGLKLPSV
jgi:hypothetical protein